MNASAYLDATRDLYKDAALTPQQGLCCTTSPIWQLPGLSIPPRMLAMNYGCGSTVHPRDLTGSPTMLYVGVGGGLRLYRQDRDLPRRRRDFRRRQGTHS